MATCVLQMDISEAELITLLNELPNKNIWAIIMLGGGHFAAGIYKGKLKNICFLI